LIHHARPAFARGSWKIPLPYRNIFGNPQGGIVISGMSTFTLVHVAISLVGILSGLTVVVLAIFVGLGIFAVKGFREQGIRVIDRTGRAA
jgi:hypothetical protein